MQMVIPATIVSTLLGALNGYSLSLWRFRGDNIVFGIMTLGVFLPEQMRLVPWVIVLRDLGLFNTISGLVLIHIVQGMSFTTLFCRNYYVSIPQDLLKAARIDGAGYFRIFWRIVLPLSPPILIVTVIWQFTGIWNEYLYGVTFSAGEQQPITAALIALSARLQRRPALWGAERRGAAGRRTDAAGVSVRRPLLPARPDRRSGEVRCLPSPSAMSGSATARCRCCKGIDLEIESGEFTILVGPSGCGKSTLLNIIAGLDTASQGMHRDRWSADERRCGRRTATSRWCSSPTRSIRR